MRAVNRKRALFLLVGLITFASLVGNILQEREIRRLRWMSIVPDQFLADFDRPYVTRAITLWATKTHASEQAAMEERSPSVMHIGGETCISLELRTVGSVGGDPVY